MVGEIKFKNLLKLLRKKGEEMDHSYIMDCLHDEASDYAYDACKELGINPDDLSTKQEDDALLAYKDGFWEPTHKAERTALKKAVKELLEDACELKAMKMEINRDYTDEDVEKWDERLNGYKKLIEDEDS